MAKIIGNTTATPNPRPDWNQTDETKADFIKNKPSIGAIAKKDEITKTDLTSDVQASLDKADTAIQSIDGLATEIYVNEKVANIVNSAPETLDTLNELAQALGDDPNFATTVATQIGQKVDKEEGKELSSNDFTDEYQSKLDGIESEAQVNLIESISANGTPLEPDENKNVDIPLATTKFEQGEEYDEAFGGNIIVQIEVAGDAGLMSGEEKLKLKNIEEKAQVNKLEKIKLGDEETTITDKVATIPYAHSELVYPEVGINPDPYKEYFGGLMSAEDKQMLDSVSEVYTPLPTRFSNYSVSNGVYVITLENNKIMLDCTFDSIELNWSGDMFHTGTILSENDLNMFNSEIVWTTGSEVEPQIAFPSNWVFIGYDVEDKVLIPQMNTVYDIVVTGKGSDVDGDFSVIAYVSGYEVN